MDATTEIAATEIVPTTTVQTAGKIAKKVAKKAAKQVAKKAAAKKAKPNTAPKSKPMSLNGKSVHSEEPTREPKWSDRRKNIVLAMRQLGALDAKSAVPASKISALAGKKASSPELLGEGVFYTKIVLDVYRTNELVHNGFVASIRHEGDRELSYYLTAKGKTTKFPEAVKAAKEE